LFFLCFLKFGFFFILSLNILFNLIFFIWFDHCTFNYFIYCICFLIYFLFLFFYFFIFFYFFLDFIWFLPNFDHYSFNNFFYSFLVFLFSNLVLNYFLLFFIPCLVLDFKLFYGCTFYFIIFSWLPFNKAFFIEIWFFFSNYYLIFGY